MKHEVTTSLGPNVLYRNNGNCNKHSICRNGRVSLTCLSLLGKVLRAWEMAFNYCNNLFLLLFQEENKKVFLWQVLQTANALMFTSPIYKSPASQYSCKTWESMSNINR